MQTLPIEGPLRAEVEALFATARLFRVVPQAHHAHIIGLATASVWESGERVATEGEASTSAWLVMSGALDVLVKDAAGGERLVATIGAGATAGEVGVLLDESRTASLAAKGTTRLLGFSAADLKRMMERLPGFGMEVARFIAERLATSGGRLPLTAWNGTAATVDPRALDILPVEFMGRHRVMPVAMSGRTLTVGFVADPTPEVLAAITELIPTMEVQPVRIDARLIETVLGKTSGELVANWTAAPDMLNPLLRRMVSEGASDLHLSARHQPRWRLHGHITPLTDLPVLGPDTVSDMLWPVMDERIREEFANTHDVDFATAIEGVARFRVNMFRDNRGASAVIRVIPAKVLSVEQLGLPESVKKLCDHPKGLVLVTGPTGSGKSTTLAAMIDAINRGRPVHILTLEDPIEFVHESKTALVNQREVGNHTASFTRALKAALREDPDVVLVGELRDRETVQMALETANTGHLVFATLHTNTAPSTIERIVDLFPSDQQGAIRATLAEVLRGVVCQVLCRKLGGGRVAALEILIATPAVLNLVREAKTFQLASTMQVGGSHGQQLLNQDLARLVQEKLIDPEEAMSRAVDKPDLQRRIAR